MDADQKAEEILAYIIQALNLLVIPIKQRDSIEAEIAFMLEND